MIKNNREYVYRINNRNFHCAMDITMHFIGGKWKTVVLWYLINGKKRFSELRRHIPEITEKMLSLQLKALEKDKFIVRKVYPVVPPKVEYSLSDTGRRIIPLLQEMAKWGREKGESDGQLMATDKPTIIS